MSDLDHRAHAAVALVEHTQKLAPGHPQRFERVDDVPADLAVTLPLLFEGSVYFNGKAILHTFMMLPWIATASAEQFYLPVSLSEYCPHWHPAHTLELLDDYREYMFRDRPARAKPVPGRNEPCLCGSGKKYKRCCGAG